MPLSSIQKSFFLIIRLWLCSFKVMFSLLSAYLSVSLWAGYFKKLWTDYDETWWTGWACDKEELILFWWRSESASRYYIFFYFLHHCEMGPKTIYSMTFQTLWKDYGKTWWVSWVGDKNKLIRLWLRFGSRSSLSVGYKTETVQHGGRMYSTECRSRFWLLLFHKL